MKSKLMSDALFVDVCRCLFKP